MVSVQLPFPVFKALGTLITAGHQAYLVGGAVRDVLIGTRQVLDWDITTNATPEQVLALFADSFYDNAFGTVMIAPKHILMQSGIPEESAEQAWSHLDVLDITTFRTEDGYQDSRHPGAVTWGNSLEEDVQRRDFTINAIALEIQDLRFKTQDLQDNYSLPVEVNAEIRDFHKGQEDLDNRIIRAVGDPDQRFKEDALRMMRAIRIGAELSFAIESETLKAIQDNAQLIRNISGERVRTELMKILASPYPSDGIRLLHTAGILTHILPEIEEGINVPQGGRHKLDVWNHALESLRECPSKDPLVRLATLLHDVGKPRTMQRQGPRGVTFYGHEVVGAHMCNRIADRLRLSKKQKNKLFTLVRWHMFTYSPEMTDSAVKRFIRRVGLENINDMMMLRIGDRKGGGSKATSWRLRELQQRIGENLYEPLGLKDLKVNGSDLMQHLEITPGPIIGTLLNTLFEEVMEDKLPNETEALIARAKSLYTQQS